MYVKPMEICQSSCRRFVAITVVVILTTITRVPTISISQAQVLQEWNNTAGGSFGDSSNWQSGAVPVALDDVVFDVATAIGDSPGVYAVTFGSDRTVNSLEISNDDVTFQLMSHAWELADVVVIGLAGSSVSRVQDGSLTSGGAGIVGAPGNPAKIELDGATTSWTASGGLLVGAASTGTLDVVNGANVRGEIKGLIGNSPDGNGTANIDGIGSQLTISSQVPEIVPILAIGNAGIGELNITNGAVVSNESIDGTAQTQIGAMNGTGTVNVTGPGSSLAVSGLLFLGKEGNGTLLVSDGAMVSNTGQAQIAIISTENRGTGNATVTGVGSVWTSTESLFVDVTGVGQLMVAAGGSVLSGADLNIGTSPLSNGKATVTGTSSTLSSTAHTRVGFAGRGELDVLAGGQVTTTGQGSIGLLHHSQGTVNVDGNSSTWTLEDLLAVGGNGTANLNVSDGGTVTVAGEAQIGIGDGTGRVSISGNDSNLTTNDLLFIGADGTGDGNLSITNGGTVISEAAGIVGALVDSNGDVMVDGNGSHWQISTVLSVGNAGTGSLLVSDGGQVTNFDVAQIGKEAGSNGTVTIDGNGSIWTSWNALSVGGGDTAGGNGHLTVQNDGQLIVDGTLKILSTGNVTLAAGAINADTLDLSDGGILGIVGGELKTNQIVGSFVFNDGTLSPGMDNVLTSQTVSSSVAPEPSMGIQMVVGLIVLGFFWRDGPRQGSRAGI